MQEMPSGGSILCALISDQTDDNQYSSELFIQGWNPDMGEERAGTDETHFKIMKIDGKIPARSSSGPCW